MVLLKRAIALLLFIALCLAASSQVELPQKLSDERITLLYPPSLVSPEEARLFLEEQEGALSWVEERLGLRYEGRLQITIESDWFSWYSAATDRFGRRIIYIYESYPLRWLNTLERTPVHELVHAVTIKNWGLSAPFLMEGLAVALDTDYRGLLSPNLVSYGLLRDGKLPFLDIRQEELRWLDYYPAGSFAHFIIRRYGLGRFGELYRLVGERWGKLWDWARRTSPGAEEFAARAAVYIREIEAGVEESFDGGLDGLHAEWERSLQAFSELEERAADALRALDGWEGVWELRVQLGGFGQIGVLGPVPQRMRELRTRMVTALRLLLNDPAPETAQGEFEQFQRELQAYRPLLGSWWAAAQAFMDVRELIYYGTTGYDVILVKLNQAWSFYSQVGDMAMAAKVEGYIEAFEALQDGERLIRGPGCEQGLELLRQAEEIFRELDDLTMASRVHKIITLRPTCYQPA